jgi:hypothetical protein
MAMTRTYHSPPNPIWATEVGSYFASIWPDAVVVAHCFEQIFAYFTHRGWLPTGALHCPGSKEGAFYALPLRGPIHSALQILDLRPEGHCQVPWILDELAAAKSWLGKPGEGPPIGPRRRALFPDPPWWWVLGARYGRSFCFSKKRRDLFCVFGGEMATLSLKSSVPRSGFDTYLQ